MYLVSSNDPNLMVGVFHSWKDKAFQQWLMNWVDLYLGSYLETSLKICFSLKKL